MVFHRILDKKQGWISILALFCFVPKEAIQIIVYWIIRLKQKAHRAEIKKAHCYSELLKSIFK